MSLFELCSKIAASNSSNQGHLKGVRIIDKDVVVTDMISTLRVHNVMPEGLDCYVDAAKFGSTWKFAKTPEIEQTPNELILKENKAKFSLTLLDKNGFFADKQVPKGTSVEPKNFIQALHNLAPFLNGKKAPTTYVADGYLFASDRIFLVRTKLDTEFGTTEDTTVNDDNRPFNIPLSVIDTLRKIKDNPSEIKFGTGVFSVIYPSCWLESATFGDLFPVSFKEAFQNSDTTNWIELPADVFETLQFMCKEAGDDDKLQFGPMGITLKQGSEAKYEIDYKMPLFHANAKIFGKIMENANKFNFDDKRKVWFKGEHIEGYWPNMASAAPTPVKTEEQKELAPVT